MQGSLIPRLSLSVLAIHARDLIAGVRGHTRELHGEGEPGNEANTGQGV